MLKYAAATALALITMLMPAVSAGVGPPGWMPRYEVDCDSSARGLPKYAIFCHCTFECSRRHPAYWFRSDVVNACWKTCVKAKDPSIFPRP
jgi:hypothetical protein